MKSRQIIVALFVAAFVAISALPPVFAGDPARTGTAGGVQVLVPVGARDLGMGGANIAYTSGLEAAYWNPAGLSMLDRRASAQFSTMQMFNDIRVNYAGIGVQAGRLGNLAFTFKAFDFGEIPVTTLEDPDGESGATFSPAFATIGLTYSKMLTDAISFGVTGKVVHEEAPRVKASAAAFDMGLQYRGLGGVNGLSVGLAVKNIGTDMKYDGSALLDENNFTAPDIQSDELPASIEMAVGYRYNINESNSFIAAGNFQNNNLGNDVIRLGGEFNYGDFIFLRGGYLAGSDIDSDAQLYRYTAGVGLNLDVNGTALMVDYAFRDSQYFDGNHLFSLTLGF
ncbi:MAG TPA: PorV/PorQ family protein [Calditrichia bacterium]|nr:PorV/PorQ family protein [Calditrichia bacterium]